MRSISEISRDIDELKRKDPAPSLSRGEYQVFIMIKDSELYRLRRELRLAEEFKRVQENIENQES